MEYQFSFLLSSCGSCVSKNHCKDCCKEIADALRENSLIHSITLDPIKKHLTIESPAEEEVLGDLLDDMKVYVF